jgi:hypothetical protein
LKRMLKIFVVGTLMGAMLLASALPAFANHGPANDENASCIGAAGSASSTNADPNATGESRSYFARNDPDRGRLDSFAKIKDPDCVFEPAP